MAFSIWMPSLFIIFFTGNCYSQLRGNNSIELCIYTPVNRSLYSDSIQTASVRIYSFDFLYRNEVLDLSGFRLGWNAGFDLSISKLLTELTFRSYDKLGISDMDYEGVTAGLQFSKDINCKKMALRNRKFTLESGVNITYALPVEVILGLSVSFPDSTSTLSALRMDYYEDNHFRYSLRASFNYEWELFKNVDMSIGLKAKWVFNTMRKYYFGSMINEDIVTLGTKEVNYFSIGIPVIVSF